MNSHGLIRENLVATLPAALQKDPSAVALAEAMADLLARRPEEIEQLRIYPVIDRLDERLLDILAYDFKVDWWDADYSLEEKRRTLKDSWRVHKTLGTKAAVETAIRAIYPLTTVEEWFEYGGEPYHFRLNIDITSDSGDRARQKRVLERLNYYKSLRSHNDGVRYFLMPEKSWAVAGGLFVGSREVDRAAIQVPELEKPGGKAALIAGGGLTGSRNVERVGIKVPALIRPGGEASFATGGTFVGSVQRIEVKLNANEAKAPAGTAATESTAGVLHSYQRMRVYIPTTISGR